MECGTIARYHLFQTSVHDAGSALLLTNSFDSDALCLKLHGVQDRVTKLNTAACLA